MICEKCFFNHDEHLKQVRELSKEDVEKFCENAIAKMTLYKEKITSLSDSLNEFKSK